MFCAVVQTTSTLLYPYDFASKRPHQRLSRILCAFYPLSSDARIALHQSAPVKFPGWSNASSAAGAFELVADEDWPPQAVSIRVLDADGREVHSFRDQGRTR
jgi:hypothetical protein